MQAILFTDVTTDPELFVGFQKHLKCGYALLFFKYVVQQNTLSVQIQEKLILIPYKHNSL